MASKAALLTSEARSRFALSLVIAAVTGSLFWLVWFLECPRWVEGAGLDCFLVTTIVYFLVSPALSVVNLFMIAWDFFKRRLRLQALSALILSGSVLYWLATHPPR